MSTNESVLGPPAFVETCQDNLVASAIILACEIQRRSSSSKSNWRWTKLLFICIQEYDCEYIRCESQ